MTAVHPDSVSISSSATQLMLHGITAVDADHVRWSLPDCYMQMSTTEIKADLRDLYIVGAKQVELTGGKKAIIIFVPYRYVRAANIQTQTKQLQCISVHHAMVGKREPVWGACSCESYSIACVRGYTEY